MQKIPHPGVKNVKFLKCPESIQIDSRSIRACSGVELGILDASWGEFWTLTKIRKQIWSNKIKKTENLGKKELAATPYHRINRFFWTLDLGPCSGMNDHPGRDTDVRSRPSESTIKDLSFYIGFTRIQSSIKHLGPCFGTNGHFRRDPDVISRLPDTTIDFLSVFIGFRS